MNPKLLLIFLFLACSVSSSAKQKQQSRSEYNQPKKQAVKSNKKPSPKNSKSRTKPPEAAPPPREACLFFVDSVFRKDRLREVKSSGFVLTKLGEAFIYRNEMKRGRPYRQWLLFRYADSAYYVVDPLAETAVRTPRIIFPAIRQVAASDTSINPLAATADGSTDVQFGFKTRKYTLTLNDGRKLDQWVATELTFPLGHGTRMAAALQKFQLPDKLEYGERAGCFVLNEKLYDENGKLTYSRSLDKLDLNNGEHRFFDLSGFGITDILTGWVVQDPQPDSTEKKR